MAGPLGEMFDHGCDALNTTVRLRTMKPRRGNGTNLGVLPVARSSALYSCPEPWPVMVDCLVADCISIKLLLDYLGGILYWYASYYAKVAKV